MCNSIFIIIFKLFSIIRGYFYGAWEKLYSNLIQQLKSIENELLAFLSFPPAIRPTIYSTNILESLNKRIKRKTKPKE
nr:transposase [Pediococcus acidilactici]